MINRETTLQEAQRIVYGERSKSHGSIKDVFKTMVDIFTAWTGIPLTAEQAAQFLICLKLARYRYNPTIRDHLVDLAGYAEILSVLNRSINNGENTHGNGAERYTPTKAKQEGSELRPEGDGVD